MFTYNLVINSNDTNTCHCYMDFHSIFSDKAIECVVFLLLLIHQLIIKYLFLSCLSSKFPSNDTTLFIVLETLLLTFFLILNLS